MARLVFYLLLVWLTIIFIFLPHYVELTGVLETWFSTQGLVYYKDFAAYHFPLGRLILLPIHLISNWNLEVDPWLGLIIGLATLYTIYIFGQRFLSVVGTAISLVFFSIFFWYAATGILFFHEILIGLFLALIIYLLFKLHNERKVNNRLIFSLGILIAITELSGQIATITLGVISILTLYEISKNHVKNTILYYGIFLAGIAIPFLLFSIYFLLKGALLEFYHYNITYYLLYANYKRDSLLSLPIADLLVFYIPLLALLAITLLQKLQKIDYKIVFALFLSASTIPFIIFSIYHPHHLNYALPILAITAGIAYDISKNHKLIFLSGVAIFLLILITSLLPWHIERIKFPPNFRIANDLYPDSKDPMKDAVNWVKDNTFENTRIMVMGDALFYLRSDRLSSARPSKGMPYGWNPMSQIEKEITENRPDFWIVSRGFTKALINYWNRPDIIQFLDSELENCYILKINFEDWQIWEKRCK